MNRTERFATDPIPVLVRRTCTPLALSMLAQGVDIVDDGLFVAHYGELAYRASTVAYPVQVAVMAVAVGTSIGVNSVLSRALGRHDGRGARSVKANALFLALAGAAVCLAAGLFSSSPIARCLTRDEQTQSLVTSYLRIYLIGAGTLFLSVTFERFLQAHGLMRECMLVQVTGVVVNLALDPLLIFVLDLGLVGAGLGTVLGQVASGALALGFYLRGVGMPIEVRPNAASCCDTYAVALPVILTELSESIMMFVLGGVAGRTDPLFMVTFTTYYKLWVFVFLAMNGFGQGLIPLVGYNVGRGDADRVRAIARYGARVVAAGMLVCTLVFVLLWRPMLWAFKADATMYGYGAHVFRQMALGFVFCGVANTLALCCTATGNGRVLMVATYLRQLIVPLPLFALIMGTAGVSWACLAFVAGDVCAALYARSAWGRAI